ncbi:hypothetical protein LRY65_01730 [Candidatus Woesebacteria bacterium]|nr:hypothetical protein [Candidatus Woesebacteria bacterium]MCD8507118.1 hypothetical protein [Candidatus Woesebacteria bacterium]MCD8526911.1 hypothetical protein [Candidatus Woesebacteria bacterium]MCD8546060.1 hypothetical protein [Candidatus Woesebacteria bacterium]
MGYLDTKKSSKKKEQREHVSMARMGGKQNVRPGAQNAGGQKNMLSRRKGER